MRNALVLAPLCIGLTCGFIVPTRTSEHFTPSMVTLKDTATATNGDILKNDSVYFVRINSQLHNIKQDDVHGQVYNEGSEKNKTIEERSFIFVNQGWSKQPYKSNSVDTKLTNSLLNNRNLKQASRLNVFRENPRENVVLQEGTVNNNMKYLNEKHKQYMEHNDPRNKSVTAHKIENKIPPNQDNSIHYTRNKDADNKNYFIEVLKTSLIRPAIKGIENIRHNIKNKFSNNDIMKHFMEFNREDHNIEAYKNKKQNITKNHKDTSKNTPNTRDKIKYLTNESYVNVVTEHQLFHLLLEEQVPRTMTIHKNHNSTMHSKYCRKCARLSKLSTLKIEAECECRCGRYIHLKGRT